MKLVGIHHPRQLKLKHLLGDEMRRQRKPSRSRRAPNLLFRYKPDSDESISDEEEEEEEDDDVFPNIGLPLDPTATTTSQSPLEDEVEIPDFIEGDIPEEVVANSTDEETNSADGILIKDNTVLSTRQLQKYGPQSIRNEDVRDTTRISEALLHSKESASASHATCSKENLSGFVTPFSFYSVLFATFHVGLWLSHEVFQVLFLWKCPVWIWNFRLFLPEIKGVALGRIWKAKPRFSLPSMSHKFGSIGPSISKIESLPEIIKAVDSRNSDLDGNYLEDDDQIEINSDSEPAETEAFPCGFNLAKMDDFFDNLQDKAAQSGNMIQLFQKRSRSPLLETVIDSEDSPEPVDSGSSSGNEVTDQQMEILPGKKMQTMAERFEEALGTSSVITEGTRVGALNSLRAGLFGKLQQMMLKEKETDMDFWKKLQAGAKPDSELGCVVVKIISRYPDGKLTVCHCSFGKYTENFLLQDNSKGVGYGGSESRQNTIIFSSRVCSNVNLEVGNLIRIHPPWKEVKVGNDNIMLCTYFSEILFPV
ncbi:hypothetical protein Fmac_020590 [Flemingia macrophylla]|uniref:Uncharacterized protein n=1 Tax=Flemingia macrophylla TaxID=520843 RepID=A0ABD1LUE8_9FABA